MPPLLQQTDTCSKSDSESAGSFSEDQYCPPIPIVQKTTTNLKHQTQLDFKPTTVKTTNNNRQYFINGQ